MVVCRMEFFYILPGNPENVIGDSACHIALNRIREKSGERLFQCGITDLGVISFHLVVDCTGRNDLIVGIVQDIPERFSFEAEFI